MSERMRESSEVKPDHESLSSETGEKILRNFLRIVGRYPEMLKRNESIVEYGDGSELRVAFAVGTHELPVLTLQPSPTEPISELPAGVTFTLPIEKPGRIHEPGKFPREVETETVTALYRFMANYRLTDIKDVRPTFGSDTDREKAQYMLRVPKKKRD